MGTADYDTCSCGQRKTRVSRTCRACYFRPRANPARHTPCIDCGRPNPGNVILRCAQCAKRARALTLHVTCITCGIQTGRSKAPRCRSCAQKLIHPPSGRKPDPEKRKQAQRNWYERNGTAYSRIWSLIGAYRTAPRELVELAELTATLKGTLREYRRSSRDTRKADSSARQGGNDPGTS
jgi:hypothetical protein